jgi:hypothetical protein
LHDTRRYVRLIVKKEDEDRLLEFQTQKLEEMIAAGSAMSLPSPGVIHGTSSVKCRTDDMDLDRCLA